MLFRTFAYAGSILLGSGIGAGYCVYGLASFLYYDIYPPVSTLHLVEACGARMMQSCEGCHS